MRITLEVAKALLEAAEKKARELGLAEDIAIVDEGGNLIAFHRMDHARLAGIDIAQNKAWTSVALKMPTANLAQAAQPGGPSYGINTTNQGRIVILGGGIPLMKDGMVYGGIGASGATSAQDIEVVNAAVQLYERMHPAMNARIGSISSYR
ncbi:heme-binding protein [Paenibacillus hodogayensis]|uniref:Heme-binding protein n=1 Tax=Paenibacillus hodogayensis TaxID=279208 RepID=A0ABV5W6G5_9BACL